jgi:hypothetical protein
MDEQLGGALQFIRNAMSSKKGWGGGGGQCMEHIF